MKETQVHKVLRIWIDKQSREQQKFFKGFEFMQDGNLFVGYKAPARFTEMCIDYPDLIESKMDGKYRVGRLRFENSTVFLKTLPYDIAQLVEQEMKGKVIYKKIETVVVTNPETRSVKFVDKVIEL